MRIEHELSPVVKEWLKGTRRSPYTAQQTVGQVMKRLPETGQGRHHRWVFPWRRDSSTSAPWVAAPDLKPSPIPAPNGHAPTVTGRTQSMFSPAKAITAGALVFAIGGAFLIAQPFDQQGGDVPGAATDDPPGGEAAALVSGRFVSSDNDFESSDTFPFEQTVRQRGRENTGRSEMSDERLSGDVTVTDNGDFYLPDWEDILWGTISIVNDEGTWDGRLVGTSDVLGVGSKYYELVGSGAYEGLSAVVFETEASDELHWGGVIFPGELPPDR